MGPPDRFGQHRKEKGVCGMNRIEDLQNLLSTNISKVTELINKKEEEEKRGPKAKTIFAIIGIIVVVAAAAYGLYRFFAPDYLEDFEDDLDDEFEEDFFDDEDVKEEEPVEKKDEDVADAEEPFVEE